MLAMIEKEENPSETHKEDRVNIKVRIQEIRDAIAENNQSISRYEESLQG